MRYTARHLMIARLPTPRPPGGGMIPAQPSPAPSPPWPGSGGAAPGIPGAAGMAWRDWRWPGCQYLLRAAVSPHRPSGHCLDFFESCCSSWSPVTESNRRPSPYHACRFRPMASRWVRLPQVGGIGVSGCVTLRPTLPEGVVTWFVTCFRTSFQLACYEPESASTGEPCRSKMS
jgi:hypothetical protein